MLEQDPIAGAAYLLRGFAMLPRRGLRRYVLVPLGINSALLILAVYAATSVFSGFMERTLPGWLSWLEWLLWPLFALTFLVIVFFTFSMVANLVAAPFHSLLAAEVERMASGRAPQTSHSLVTEAGRTLCSEVQKLAYTLLRGGPLLLLMLVPGLGLLVTPLWLIFSAWMQSLQYADYPMGNHGMSFVDQRRVHARRRLLSLGFGGAVTAAMLVPVVNLLVMPAAVAGATLMWVERLQQVRT